MKTERSKNGGAQMRSQPTPTIMQLAGGFDEAHHSGTSIFDPLLCELVYRWFCPPSGAVLDPFAGGSVRGIVAARLGLRYTGVDLSARQLAANELQARELLPKRGVRRPKWIEGDSRQIGKLATGKYDLIFSCPPYADLEIYSDDPADISNMSFAEFRRAYEAIVKASCELLRPDRFAVFVIGDVRGPDGFYRKLPWLTIEAFEKCGAKLYNEAVLITAFGSLPIRAARPFARFRKLGKTHQNVLIFFKGDPAHIPAEFPEVHFDPAIIETWG
jgi:hypothetical protein